MKLKNIREFRIKDYWTVHSYYTLDPYAPDGSGRILCAGCDPDKGVGEVFILDKDGKVIDRFGKQSISAIFFHTGFWQSWGRDGKYVYYQSADGDPTHPRVTVRELSSGHEETIDADCEGTPMYGEPFLFGLSGMYYASGYRDGRYHPEESPIPFEERDRHGLFMASPLEGKKELILSVNEILKIHPLRERLISEDKKYENGLTLMVYCARFDRTGKRVMFHFGNHCTAKSRGEPHIMSLFTADFEDGRLSNLAHALDMNFEKNGVHWSWDNDGGLIGYYGRGKEQRLYAVDRDGRNLRKLSDSTFVGGHPSVCPADRNVVVTDGWWKGQGRLLFLKNGEEDLEIPLGKRVPDIDIPTGRNRYYVCHHPVFSPDGRKLLCNFMSDRLAGLCEIEPEF